MNIYEAIMTNKPFNHPDGIGAFMVWKGKYWIHRDNANDFRDTNFINRECITLRDMKDIWGVNLDDLLRDDWETFDIEV